MFKKSFTLMVLMLTILSMSSFTQAKDFKYVGVKKCKTCHKTKKIGNQYGIWKKAAHSNALKSLSSKEAMEYAKKHGIADPTKDEKCLKCHSTMATVDKKLIDPKGKMTIQEGVSCESCHGPGSKYKKMSVMKNHDKAIANGLIMPTEQVCKTCHNKENPFYKPFDYKKMVAKISHPIPKKK